MSTATTAAPSAIDRAHAIYREVMAATWPDSPEAMAAIGYARDYLAGEIGVHARLLARAMCWHEFDADLLFFSGDPQDEAITIAADRCLEAAKALMSRLREYQGRGVAAVVRGTEGGEGA